MIDSSGLAANYAALVSGHTTAKYFALMPSLNQLMTWKVTHRYFDTSHVDYPKADEPKWLAVSKEIQTAVDEALIDGHPIY